MDAANQLCKLFVGGLNVDTDDDGLRKHFEQYGQLTDCVVVVNKQLQRSRCFGFVTYSSGEEADAAMAARPHVVDGTNVELKRAVAREDAGKPEALAKVKKIFIGGLKDDIEDEHLNDYFSQFGEIEKAEVIAEKETGKKRGFGFVHFTDNDSADKAVVVKFHTINGHKVEVKKALTKQEDKMASVAAEVVTTATGAVSVGATEAIAAVMAAATEVEAMAVVMGAQATEVATATRWEVMVAAMATVTLAVGTASSPLGMGP
uniref:Heteroous nuclear ribonucleoprotein A0 n=1 Tax=Oncorhynchus kisutch TaxID=8019 RepID=A0A8C7IU03_ONCKI